MLLFVLGVLSLYPAPGSLQAHDEATDARTAQALDAIHPLTVQLVKLADRFGKGAPAERQAMLDELRHVIEARRQALLILMESRPAAVLDVTLPDAVRRALPVELQHDVEQHTSLEGTLTVTIASNFDLQLAKVFYTLAGTTGESVELHFVDGKGPDLLTGSRVKVHGVRLADQMALTSADSGSVETITAAQLAPLTVKKVAVILVNFQDKATQPYTPTTAKSVMFTTTNAYYQEVSFGKMALQGALSVDGDVFGWYTIPVSSTVCDTSSIATYGKAAAQADGFVAANYTNIQYAFPNNACSWWGLGTVGGNPGSTWINGSYALKVTGHELGHNFTFYHSNSYTCTDATGQRVAISSTCTSTEYGDPFDIMGNPSSGHVNNYQKGRLGFNATASPEGVFDAVNVQDVTVDGLYTIAPLEYASSGVQALRIPRDVDSTGKILKYLYLEFRQPYGFDNNSYGTSAAKGVLIRLAPPYSSGTAPLLLDATPGTSGFTDAALLPGKTFEDPSKGITVTTQSVSSTVAEVQVKFGPIVCTLANPSVAIAPSSQWGFPGQTLNYTLTLTNNNTSSCSPASFNVGSALPTGWSQSPAAPSFSVSSGSSVSQTISVTAASDALPDFYTITETATNAADSRYTASASATYNVQPPDTTPPTVTITSPANGATLPKKGSVTIAASASDASGIKLLELSVDGTLLKSCANVTTCSVRWSVNQAASGSHTITAKATDNGGPTPNAATASVTVFKP